jgi:integrase
VVEIREQGPRPGCLHILVGARNGRKLKELSQSILKDEGTKAGITGVTHQMLRRTCSTYMAQLTTVKDVQAHLRHATAKTTLEHYIKSIPDSVRVAVESLDHLLKAIPTGSEKPAN